MTAIDNTDIRSEPYSWRELTGMILTHRRELIIANIVAVLGTVAAVPVPLLAPLLVDEVLLDQPGAVVGFIDRLFPESWQGPVLYVLAVLFVTLVLRILSLALNVWQTRQFTLISKDVIFRIRRSLLQRLSRVSMSEYETLGSSTVASHLVTDLAAIDDFVSVTSSRFLVALLSIIGTAIVLLWMNWQLAVFILLLNPFVVYTAQIFGRRVKQLKQKENSAFQLFQESLAETLDAIQQIRASNREQHYLSRIITAAGNIRHHSAAYTWRSDAANRLSFLVFLFGFDIFRTVAMLMVVFSDLTIGQMLAVFAYLWFMMGPVQEVLNIQYSYHAAKAALGRINELVDIDLEPRYPHLKNPFASRRTVAIRLEKICFSYGEGPPVLDDVSLTIPAGQKVALVGASGGGKTTLVQILLGLYRPKSGQVYFDEVPMSEIGLDVARTHVATVLQHPALFNDSVRMNLTLGREYGDAALWRALDVAQLSEDLRDMGLGLDSLIGRDGVRLSGGQRQRMAVARMVLVEPSVVVLDEATSALDTVTEEHLHDALSTFLEGRTTLIIAHRLSAVKQADRVLVFEDGRIVEDGRHDDLIQGAGLYASLYGSQES